LVEFGGDSIPGDLVHLRTQGLGHSIPEGRFTSSPNLSSRAQAVWEIHVGIGEVDFSVFTPGCFVRGLADCPPLARGLSVSASSSHVRPVLVSSRVDLSRCQISLQVVCRTVRVGVSARLRGGRTVRLGIADSPRGTSCSRTVRGPGTDRPRVGVLVWLFCCD
jgi:hypothetical protein